MAQLSTKVKEYLKANGKTYVAERDNFELRNDSDGSGDYLKSWNVSGLAQPTQSELDSLESAADATEALGLVYQKRKSEYPSISELVVALYDTEDKAAIDAKRAEIKLKYPKGP